MAVLELKFWEGVRFCFGHIEFVTTVGYASRDILHVAGKMALEFVRNMGAGNILSL